MIEYAFNKKISKEKKQPFNNNKRKKQAFKNKTHAEQ